MKAILATLLLIATPTFAGDPQEEFDGQHMEIILKLGRIALGQESADEDDRKNAILFIKNVDVIDGVESKLLKDEELEDGGGISVWEYKIHGGYLGGGDMVECGSTTTVIHTIEGHGEWYSDSFDVKFELDQSREESHCPNL